MEQHRRQQWSSTGDNNGATVEDNNGATAEDNRTKHGWRQSTTATEDTERSIRRRLN